MGVPEDLKAAREIISQDDGPPKERFDLAIRLGSEQYFTHARKVLKRARLDLADERLRYDIRRKLALFTYKDQDEPARERLDEAQKILESLLEIQPPKKNPGLRQDVYGILGAVHKRRWDIDGKPEHLTKSFECYQAGYQMGPTFGFYGYTAVNAAFVEDLLAEVYANPLVAYAGSTSDTLHRDSENIRKELIRAFGDKTDKSGEDRYWDCVTLGEAHLGIGAYDRACEWMAEAAAVSEAVNVKNWMVETTARQIARLVRLEKERNRPKAGEKCRPWQVLEAFMRGNSEATDSFLRGKFGLALSGGGFRASLFHIGVLAKLAEMDLLRHIEVISCVSGGSILGAYYYLELQLLLETTPEPRHTDYIRLVQRVERNFLAGVQKNIRLRVLLHPMSNIRLVLRESSTTHRLGDLYEKELYARIEDGKARAPRYMDQLKVRIKDKPDFNPKYDNWRRRAKVPILVLNATSLNTCHNWQFTATTIGEPPVSGSDNRIDANDRLRRLWYDEAPESFQKFRLGHAVAASACVPGLFDPLGLDKLYDGYIARLVDGGVFDNQGVASLREQDCTVLLVSDASGQTGVEEDPKTSNLAVPVRANNILMARVRQSEYQHVESLRAAEVVRGFGYVHLKKGLKAPMVDWRGCIDRSDSPTESLRTNYGMRRDIQRLLSAVRTDLDSFSDVEADCLMLSGYRMTETEMDNFKDFPAPAPPRPPGELWRFLRVAPFACGTDKDADEKSRNRLNCSLEAAHFEAFKAFRLIPSHGTIARILKWLAVAWGVFACWRFWSVTEPFAVLSPALVAQVALALIGIGVLAGMLRWWRRKSPAWHYVLALFSFTMGWLYLILHLQVLDRIYLLSGPRYSKEYPAFCPEPQSQSARSVTPAAQG
jgi:predicted acylesterase/phospholipase RssA